MTEVLIAGFLAATVRVATPLLLAALGELLAERGGSINLGIEGSMLAGALAAAMGAVWYGTTAGMVFALLAGATLAAVFALITVRWGADQIIAGTAITLGSIGLTGAVYRLAFGAGGAGLSIPTVPAVDVPVLSRIPFIGPALFAQPLMTYLALALVGLVWWFLFRTRAGLELRATGEDRRAARAAGVNTVMHRTLSLIAGGMLAGLAGATLVLAQLGTFAEKMTAGRGFVAVALVVLGRWHPVGALLAALLFGAATALQYLFQAMALDLPYQLFIVLPYLLALIGLAGVLGRVKAPGELGRQ
jgi:simple sugar transport system permease protein